MGKKQHVKDPKGKEYQRTANLVPFEETQMIPKVEIYHIYVESFVKGYQHRYSVVVKMFVHYGDKKNTLSGEKEEEQESA